MLLDKINQSNRTTKVFAKAGLDNITSAMCKYQQRFGLDVQCSALVLQQYIFHQQRLSADGILIPNLHKAQIRCTKP